MTQNEIEGRIALLLAALDECRKEQEEVSPTLPGEWGVSHSISCGASMRHINMAITELRFVLANMDK